MKKYINSIGSIEYEYLEQLRKTIEQPGKFDYCVSDLGDTVELAYEYGKDTIIIPKDKFTPKYYPEFYLGDKVQRTDGSRTGVIYRIQWIWHYSSDKPDYFAYFLDYGDRKSTRRTKADELRKTE